MLFFKARIFLLLFFVILILYYIFSFITGYNNILKNEEEKIEFYTTFVSENINTILESIINDVESFDFLNNKSLIETYISKHNFVKNILISNEKKIVLYSIDNFLVGEKLPDELDYLSFELKENNSHFYINILLDDNLYNNLEDNLFSFYTDNINIFITDKKGKLLYSNNKKLSNKDLFQRESIKCAINGNFKLKKIYIDRETYYTYSIFLKSTNWLLVVEMKSEIILNKLLNFVFLQILSGLIVLILIISGYIYLYKIFQKIETITTIINSYPDREIVEKNKNKLIKWNKNIDELTMLYKTFYETVQKIEEIENSIVTAIENERNRIGMELHDDLGQNLTALSFQLMLLEDEVKKQNFNRFTEIKAMLEQTINKLKNIAKGLSLLKIYENDIFKAIKEILINNKKIYNIEYVFVVNDEIKINENKTIINLYYILLEIINNIIKHSKATLVIFTVEQVKEKIIIKVKDNGIGFDIDQKYNGMGLLNIRYRANLIKANLNINSNKNGTEYIIEIK